MADVFGSNIALWVAESRPNGSEVRNFDWPTFCLSLATLLVSSVAVIYAIREHRNSRESVIHEMRTKWNELQPAWARILMAEHGSDFHYADASRSERKRAKVIYYNLRSPITDPGGKGYEAALSLRSDVRAVTRFLNYAADSVLRGRWRMDEAYEVFGPDVARHHLTIRMLAHRRGDIPDWLEQALEFNTFDEHDCVFLFAFLLRAEQCRRGDTYAHFMIDLANEMQGPYRKFLDYSISNVKSTRRKLCLPLHVSLLLWRGRNPSVRTTFGLQDDPLIVGDDVMLLKRWGEPRRCLNWRIRRARSSFQNARAAVEPMNDYPGDNEASWGT